MTKVVVWKDHDKLAQKYPQAREIITRLTVNTMRVAVDHVEDQVVGRTPVNTGKLRQGWGTEIQGRQAEIWGKVVNPVFYGWRIEHGRDPGKMPPSGALEYWVIRKLGVSPDEAKSVAFLVARGIKKHGIKGRFMMRDGLKKAMPQVKRLWAALPDRITKALGK
jgi:hypothetical protein